MRMRVFGTLVTATAIAVAGAAVPAHAAEGRVFGTAEPGAIPGRYLVTTADGVHTEQLTAPQARRRAAHTGVLMVEQDRTVRLSAYRQTNPTWGLDRIDQRAVTRSKTYAPMDDGSSVHAYVIDSGVRITHAQFGGRASYGYDFADGDRTASDCNGHGTHVAGTIGGSTYGVAKKVKLVAVRVLDCEGSGSLSDVIAGINWVTKNAVKPAVANMSLGGSRSKTLEAAVAKSIKSGITYVLAAGNENVNAGNVSPAALPAAITVGATDSKDRRASFSNYGSVLDLFAPGVDILSSVATSNTAAAYYSGTSMASPHVAGAAAMVLDAFPAYTPLQVRNVLVGKATTGKVTGLKGSPNRLLFTPAPAAAPVIATKGIAVTAGKAYSGKLALTAARRGSWSLAGGSLPKGLVLSAAGAITGTPTAPGTATVQVRFVDYVPNTVTRTLTVTVQSTTPVISTTALAEAYAEVYYEHQLTVADHRAGSWAVTAGELPAGLALEPDGVLWGYPEAGEATFTVTFTDTWGRTASEVYTLIVG
ncbi:S8 family serine peptidase [Paractinoplanes rishiriensis]|uniref:Peptidase S8/S53 domain-containing protein n=1 Tax=Paractinoplanes rishiriensis TaxID=1050105 RepID=A0A919MUZ1_9ACTN|nr:S8 family serine peptidase [Actinoplanes rishiriensis]GIE93080.1 hypothetical protein Ari01nite_05450 [Actinoplanes rishiriensis]